MKQVNKKVLKVVERVMRKEAVYGIDGFPPACLGIWHQPKRPISRKENVLTLKKNKRLLKIMFKLLYKISLERRELI